MELYICHDSEELYWGYQIVKHGSSGLRGIAGIYELARASCAEDVLESIRSYKDIHDGLAGACYGGHEELALLIIRKAESSGVTVDFNSGLRGACRNNHKKLALLMIEKGATYIQWGLEEACRGGHKELTLLLIRKIESSRGPLKLGWALSEACRGGHTELVKFIVQKVKFYEVDTKCWWCYKPLDEH
jgi:hypothetical protein